jgi:hypothetical protein
MQHVNDKKTGGIWGRFRFSLDTWAVASALALALLVRSGVLKHIPW